MGNFPAAGKSGGHSQSFRERGKARIRSNPRLVVLDGETGEIRVTRRILCNCYWYSRLYPTTSLETIQAGVILNVAPRISGNDEIIIALSPEVSNVVGAGLQELQ